MQSQSQEWHLWTPSLPFPALLVPFLIIKVRQLPWRSRGYQQPQYALTITNVMAGYKTCIQGFSDFVCQKERNVL